MRIRTGDENLQAKAMIFITSESYRFEREDGPQYLSSYGRFFGLPKEDIIAAIDFIQEFVFSDRKLETLAHYIETEASEKIKLALLRGNLSERLIPMRIHLSPMLSEYFKKIEQGENSERKHGL